MYEMGCMFFVDVGIFTKVYLECMYVKKIGLAERKNDGQMGCV